MNSFRLFLFDQGFPVEYELDEFNSPHTGTTYVTHNIGYVVCDTKFRPDTSRLGNIFWRHSRFSPKQPEPQQTRLLLHYGEHISLARPTTRAAFSTP